MAFTTAPPVVGLSPLSGIQVKAEAPPADKVVPLPVQIVVEAGLKLRLSVGKENTLTVIVLTLLQSPEIPIIV